MSEKSPAKILKELKTVLPNKEEVSGATPCRRNQKPPTVRLTSVSVMSKADQQRLQMLLDELIDRRVTQFLQREGT